MRSIVSVWLIFVTSTVQNIEIIKNDFNSNIPREVKGHLQKQALELSHYFKQDMQPTLKDDSRKSDPKYSKLVLDDHDSGHHLPDNFYNFTSDLGHGVHYKIKTTYIPSSKKKQVLKSRGDDMLLQKSPIRRSGLSHNPLPKDHDDMIVRDESDVFNKLEYHQNFYLNETLPSENKMKYGLLDSREERLRKINRSVYQEIYNGKPFQYKETEGAIEPKLIDEVNHHFEKQAGKKAKGPKEKDNDSSDENTIDNKIIFSKQTIMKFKNKQESPNQGIRQNTLKFNGTNDETESKSKDYLYDYLKNLGNKYLTKRPKNNKKIHHAHEHNKSHDFASSVSFTVNNDVGSSDKKIIVPNRMPVTPKLKEKQNPNQDIEKEKIFGINQDDESKIKDAVPHYLKDRSTKQAKGNNNEEKIYSALKNNKSRYIVPFIPFRDKSDVVSSNQNIIIPKQLADRSERKKLVKPNPDIPKRRIINFKTHRSKIKIEPKSKDDMNKYFRKQNHLDVATESENIEKMYSTHDSYENHNIASSIMLTDDGDEVLSYKEWKPMRANLKQHLQQNVPHSFENKLSFNEYDIHSMNELRKLPTSSSNLHFNHEVDADTGHKQKLSFQPWDKNNMPKTIKETPKSYSHQDFGNPYKPVKNTDEEDVILDEKDILLPKRSVNTDDQYKKLSELKKSLLSEYYDHHLKKNQEPREFTDTSVETHSYFYRSKRMKDKYVTLSNFNEHDLRFKDLPKSQSFYKQNVPFAVEDEVFSTDEDLLGKQLTSNHKSRYNRHSTHNKSVHIKHEHGDRKIIKAYTQPSKNEYVYFIGKSRTGNNNNKAKRFGRNRSKRYRDKRLRTVKQGHNRLLSTKHGSHSKYRSYEHYSTETTRFYDDWIANGERNKKQKNEQFNGKYEENYLSKSNFVKTVFGTNEFSDMTEVPKITDYINIFSNASLRSESPKDKSFFDEKNVTVIDDNNKIFRTESECKSDNDKSDETDRPNEYPYVVVLQSKFTQERTFYRICSGTLITKDWVLTAAHCLVKKLALIRYGDMSLAPPGSYSRILKTVPYPSYSKRPLVYDNEYSYNTNDIALLLVEPVKLDTYGKVSGVDYKTMLGHPVIYAGFTSPSTSSERESEHKWEAKEIFTDVEDPEQSIVNPMVVGDAVVVTCEGKSFIHGPAICLAPKCSEINREKYRAGLDDAGGPLLYFRKIAGVAIKYIDSQSVYIPVSPYLDWISRVIGNSV